MYVLFRYCSDEDEEEEYEYEELDWRAEDQYWMNDNHMVVEAVESNVNPTEESDVFTEEHVSKIAINKLMR